MLIKVYDYHGTLLNKVDFKSSVLYSVKWHPTGQLSTRPLSPGPEKMLKTPTTSKGEEDFMAACREKTSGPFVIKLEDIQKANSGETREKKQEPKVESCSQVLGLPSEDKKKKKKKKKAA